MTANGLKQVGLGLLEIAMLGTLAFTLATLFDEQHYYLELFSHFRLQYLGASVLLLAAFALLRWRNYALMAVAAIAVNAWLVVPWYLPAGEASSGDDEDGAIVVMCANVLMTNGNGNGFVALARKADPDLLVALEVTPAWAKALTALDAYYPYRVVEPREGAHGIALYSKFPLESSAVVESVPRGFPDIVATAIVGGARLNIVGTHPSQPLGESNYGARNLHLDSLAALAATTPDPLIIVGDLNVTMWSVHYRRLEEKGGLVNARRGIGVVPTWPTFLLPAMIPIDHVLVSPDIRVVDFDTAGDIGSDHLPIVAKLIVPGAGAGRGR